MAGLAKAEYAMGYFTEVGIGAPANMDDAKRWYWKAACEFLTSCVFHLRDVETDMMTSPEFPQSPRAARGFKKGRPPDAEGEGVAVGDEEAG